MRMRVQPWPFAAVILATVALNAAIIAAGQPRPAPPPKDPGHRAAIALHATGDVPGLASIRMIGQSGDRSRAHDHAFYLVIHRYADPNGRPVYERAWAEPHERLRGEAGEPANDLRDLAVPLPPGRYLARAGMADMAARTIRGKAPTHVRERVTVLRSMAFDVE